jgi:hypothetical protein
MKGSKAAAVHNSISSTHKRLTGVLSCLLKTFHAVPTGTVQSTAASFHVLLLPNPELQVSPDGDVLEFLEDPQKTSFAEFPSSYRISSAHEHAGRLWLGALVANFVSYVDLKNLAPKPQALPMAWMPPVGCFTPPCDKAQQRFFRKSEQQVV